jgi:adenylosuccinate lyase
VVNPAVIARNVNRALPYMATENILMAAVARGGDRQALHERLRQHSHAVTAHLKAGGQDNDLLERLQADEAFAGVDVGQMLRPENFVGRAPQQVEEFLAAEVAPLRRRYPHLLGQRADVNV